MNADHDIKRPVGRVPKVGEGRGDDVGKAGCDVMNSYPDKKSSGLDWFGEIPLHWRCEHLKRFAARIQSGTTPPTDTPDYYFDGTIAWFTPSSYDGDLELREPRKLINEAARRDGTLRMFSAATVFLVGIGATIGKVGLITEVASCNQQIIGITCNQRLSGRYLAYQFKIYEDVIPGIASATTLPILDQVKTGYLPVLQPPREEQQRIAAYLDASCAAIDAAVAAKRRQLETLDELRKAIVQRAVTRGLTEHVELQDTGNSWMESVPRGWSLVCLKRIAEIQTGLTLGQTYEGPLIERPYLRVANVQDGHLDLDDVTLIEVPAAVAARVELRSGDVLMTEGGDLDKLGRGYLWHGEIEGCLHQNHVFAVRCFCHKLLPKFLTYVTASRYGRDYFEATGKRTTNLACTNGTTVGEFPIPLPQRDEQVAICAHLDAKLSEVKSIVTGIESQIATLTAYRKSLIHECVTGQRRVTEADLNRAQNRSPGA